MSEIIPTVVNQAIHRVLRVAGALSYGSLILPYDENVVWEPLRARRAAALKQWVLQRGTFEAKVVSEYDDLRPGEVKQLVAGTGVGKTTRMPYLVASAKQVSGLILMPTNFIAAKAVPYMRDKFAEWGGGVNVVILRSAHMDVPLSGPTIYMCSAVDVLARLARRKTLFEDLDIEFLCLDEAHENRPDYRIFRYLMQGPLGRRIRMFYATATAASDLNLESGGPGRVVVPLTADMFPMSTPTSCPVRSPLHYTAISSRTLVFVATDGEMRGWHKYYDDHDVPVTSCPYEAGSSAIVGVDAFLAANSLCVVLVNATCQTSVTFDLDVSIDCGYIQECVSNFAEKSVELRVRPVTQAERTQRMGRVGRFKHGIGYYNNVQTSAQSEELTLEIAFYVYLWAIVFNVTINEPVVAEFSVLTGLLTRKAAAILLHSRIPPFLILPYVANEGFYEGWGKALRYATYNCLLMETSQSNADKVTNWQDYRTGNVDYATAPFTFKMGIEFPKEWYVLPAYAWRVYTDAGYMAAFIGDGGRSVISMVESTRTRARSRAGSSGNRPMSGVSSLTSSFARTESIPPTYSQANLQPVASGALQIGGYFNPPTVHDVQRTFSAIDMLPPVLEAEVTMPLPSNESHTTIAGWRDAVVTPDRQLDFEITPNRRRLSSSDSSQERGNIILKQVDPRKYLEYKLYPMDPKIFAEYVDSEGVNSVDRDRVTKLSNGRRNFSALNDTGVDRISRQTEYFLSVIRVHNTSVMKKLQVSAATAGRSMLSKAIVKATGDNAVQITLIRTTANLLHACMLESYFVGVDKRTMHSRDGSEVSLSPCYDHFESRAMIMLGFGDPHVTRVVNELAKACCPYLVDNKCVANAWLFGCTLVSVRHAYVVGDDLIMHNDAIRIVGELEDTDVIVMSTQQTSGIRHRVRVAANGEAVYAMMYDDVSNRPSLVGDFSVYGDAQLMYMDQVFHAGCSGALIIAVTDGAILGLYRGFYSESDDGPVSRIIPIFDVVKMGVTCDVMSN